MNFRADMEAVKKNQMEILEKKNIVSQLTKTLEELYSKLYKHTHRISYLVTQMSSQIVITQVKAQRENKTERENRSLIIYELLSGGLTGGNRV